MGQIFVGHLLSLGRQVQVDHAPVEFAALAAQQVLFLEPVEHARHRGDAHLAHPRQSRDRVRTFEPQHDHGFPLHAGELQRLHVQVHAAHQRAP